MEGASSHLPVGVVAGVGSQDAADLHVGEPLLQHLHHVPNAQQAAQRNLVEHLFTEKRRAAVIQAEAEKCRSSRAGA